MSDHRLLLVCSRLTPALPPSTHQRRSVLAALEHAIRTFRVARADHDGATRRGLGGHLAVVALHAQPRIL